MQERAPNSNKGSLKSAMVNKTIKENAKSSKDNPKKTTKTVVTTVTRVDIGQERANLRIRVKNVSNVILSVMNLRVVQIRVALTIRR